MEERLEMMSETTHGENTDSGHQIPRINITALVDESSLDYKGRIIPIPAATGSWNAALFILAIELGERLSYFGITSNMITYLTKVMHQDLETAAKTVNIWLGVTAMMPLLGGFLADAYLGSFFIVLFSGILYALGLGILTMSQYIPSLKPCGTSSTSCQHVSKVHKAVFFTAAYLVSLAVGGYKPCLQSFGADQFDDSHPTERKQKMSFFNWWNIFLCIGLLLGVTLISYIQDFVSWGISFLILTLIMGVCASVFLFGRPFYRYKSACGSPVSQLLQVLVAAVAKRNLPCPSNPSLLYEAPNSETGQGRNLVHTKRLRFLDKAAIIENHGADTKKESPWRLVTVTQVEELKLIIAMLPIWLTLLVLGISPAQGVTFFIKQGTEMNRKVFKNFEIPAASMATLHAIAMMGTIALYDKVLIPHLRKVAGNERGINILTRIGIGIAIVIASMMIAAVVEMERLKVSLQGRKLNVFWLTPQYFIIGIGDGFALVGMQEFFYEQVPDSMKSLGVAFYLCVIGIGNFLSSFLITLVNNVSSMNGGKRWIDKELNQSHLDYFYWLLMAIFMLNLCFFVLLAKNYRYKNV